MLHRYVSRSVLSAVYKQQTIRDGIIKRGYEATRAGPPKYPISNIDFLLLGGGFIITICIMPLWAIRQVPKWSEIHNRSE